MAKSKENKAKSIDSLRHSEYYGLQKTYDELYVKAKNGYVFNNLMEIVVSRENILLAYRNIKANGGSNTPGTDKTTILDIGKLSPDQIIDKLKFIVLGSQHGYRPKPVRRKEIPKPNGKMRPLGIPCMWDRLIQQCIKQVLEPICEAKFSKNSYGFRPNCSAEHAIAASYKLMQLSHLSWVIEFDIEGFFDNVNHSKLIKQIWALGIHDKRLIYVIKKMLKAPIKLPNGEIINPIKGTPQGGIISPLLANIVLNELDQWIDGQWQDNPVVYKYKVKTRKTGTLDRSVGYATMKRNTNLKQMFIVRYADDFRIFCRNKEEARKIKIAVTQWIEERLKLKVSLDKTSLVNAKSKYMMFLGFKMKLHKKGSKYVIVSRMSDNALKSVTAELVQQAKNITLPRTGKSEHDEVNLYNVKVMGIQNYYKIATDISKDCSIIHRRIMVILTNRLKTEKGTRLVKHGRKLTDVENKLYGKSISIRYVAGCGAPIYPISYVRTKHPLLKRIKVNSFTKDGREAIHDNLKIDTKLMIELMKSQSYGRSIEFMDNRISLYSAQFGKCAVTGKAFENVDDIHCHHKTPRYMGGNDGYSNLCLVKKDVHNLIHAVHQEVIEKYLKLFNLDTNQIKKINKLRLNAGLVEITLK